MRSISDVLHDVVLESPLLEEGMAEGIVNLSALARKLKPLVEGELLRDVSEAAIVMALRRMAPEFEASTRTPAGRFISDLTVRSGLSEFTYQRSQTVIECQAKLLAEAGKQPNRFVTIAQGAIEVTAIFDEVLAPDVERIFVGERCLAQLSDLAAISVRLTTETVQSPGVYYTILKQLALHGINTVEVVSTYTELTIILEHDLIDRAFSILLRAARKK
ncbi:MAG: hypothetical protein GY906_01810 [bacterium]|nr:hypothetical protein [bacterium]